MLLLVAACGGDDSDCAEDAELSGPEWCETLWEDDLAPVDWNKDRFMSDCQDSLDTHSRVALCNAYVRLKG